MLMTFADCTYYLRFVLFISLALLGPLLQFLLPV